MTQYVGVARLVPGSALHRDASNQEKSITMATSRDAVMASCARSFTNARAWRDGLWR